MNHSNPLVAVVCGSKSDEDYVKQTISVLEELDIPYISEVVSAHRDPERLHSWIRDAEDMGVKVFNRANNPKSSYFNNYDDHMMDFNKDLINSIDLFVKSLN